ncbi:phage holin [Gracilibacillus alcaliphilus]|uniref:phage holin n=1 Tax=Gracilibacillus alcaliphilus TaxID=1401441 RepID=UPI00195EFA0F|nr:phage holin [Gracilibacillus alcaliphilus]MBM7676647.1 SPP1 family holin [Gracilibacillus alcaliphilus]
MHQAIIRLVVLAILLINQILITYGKNPLPFSEEEIYTGVSSIATILVAVYTWWKDNPVTKKAQEKKDRSKETDL